LRSSSGFCCAADAGITRPAAWEFADGAIPAPIRAPILRTTNAAIATAPIDTAAIVNRARIEPPELRTLIVFLRRKRRGRRAYRPNQRTNVH
jgi:hypothetical protein